MSTDLSYHLPTLLQRIKTSNCCLIFPNTGENTLRSFNLYAMKVELSMRLHGNLCNWREKSSLQNMTSSQWSSWKLDLAFITKSSYIILRTSSLNLNCYFPLKHTVSIFCALGKTLGSIFEVIWKLSNGDKWLSMIADMPQITYICSEFTNGKKIN